MSAQVVLSIIIPVYNEAKYIAHALESVLWQRVDFAYEIIVIDDCSTDETCSIVEQYQAKYPQIKLERNAENMGKGYSFMRAYSLAKGKYFHVLDGDDFFVNFNKLRIQKEFLDKNEDFFAICHNSVRTFDDGDIKLESREVSDCVYEYSDCMNQAFYAHTSTFMFRKIGDSLPEYFLKRPMRGDTGCFFYHAYQSKGRVMFLSMIASIYNFHKEGIWSSLNNEARKTMHLDMFDVFLNDIIQNERYYEWGVVKAKRDLVEKMQAGHDSRKHFSREEVLNYCKQAANAVFSSAVREIAFQRMHSLKHIDALCEIVGRTVLFEKNILLKDRVYKPKTVVLALSGLVPSGGGVAKEVKELVSIYLGAGWAVHIVCSNDISTTKDVMEDYLGAPGVSFWYGDREQTSVKRVEALIVHLAELAPERLYPFVTHNDVVLNASIQRGLAQEVIVDYVYDHGTSLAIYNSAIDCVVVKTESQANALSQVLGRDMIVLNPPFLKDKHHGIRYVPPSVNESINTASAAARNYKVETPYAYSYAKIIVQILGVTGGKHYHYGPLSESFLNRLDVLLADAQIAQDNFVHIPWADDFSGDLLDKKVHLFLAPFPVCSARIVIEAMSAGIPILNHVNKEATFLQSHDFTGEAQLKWHNHFDLSAVLVDLTPEMLVTLSKEARAYYETHNEFEYNKERFLSRDSLPYDGVIRANIILNDIHDVPYYTFDDYMFKRKKTKYTLPVNAQAVGLTRMQKFKMFYRQWYWVYMLEKRLALLMYALLLMVSKLLKLQGSFKKEIIKYRIKRKKGMTHNVVIRTNRLWDGF